MSQFYFVILTTISIVTTATAGMPNFTTFSQLMTSLKYGEPCSWENEEARQNLTRDLAANINARSRYGVASSMQDFANDVVSNGKQFCSASELFVCDKETEKCGCGDPGMKVRNINCVVNLSICLLFVIFNSL